MTSHGESDDEGSGERFGVQFRAQCCQTGWLMAEDFYFPCHLDTTFDEIRKAIHHQRPHISTSRLVLEVKGKDVPESKMTWTLRRNTVKNNEIIIVKPTMYDGWFWETKDFYREDFMRKIALEVIAEPSAVLSLEQIEERCGALPRPIRDLSVRVLLRLYPEKFFLRHDTTQNKTWVAISTGMQIPTWQPSPVNMGMIKQYAPRRFDWDDYQSVDSMAKVGLHTHTRPLPVPLLDSSSTHDLSLVPDPWPSPSSSPLGCPGHQQAGGQTTIPHPRPLQSPTGNRLFQEA